jgi:hypothetical protein
MMPAGIGNNYFLVMKMEDEYKKAGRYHAFVWGVPQQPDFPWKLLSFQYVGN